MLPERSDCSLSGQVKAAAAQVQRPKWKFGEFGNYCNGAAQVTPVALGLAYLSGCQAFVRLGYTIGVVAGASPPTAYPHGPTMEPTAWWTKHACIAANGMVELLQEAQA